jgi:hypothetical protein
MANTIQFKRSSTTSDVPSAGQLAVGELAINLADKKLFSKDADGNVIELVGVALEGDQTIAGVKTFTSSPVIPNATTATQALALGQINTANADPVKTALNASGTAPIYAVRAWVNFNGTGTVAIRASGNVSSITDNGTGTYTVNFTTAMANTNYGTNVQAIANSGDNRAFAYVTGAWSTGATDKTTSAFRIFTGIGTSFTSATDCADVSATVFS